MELQERPRAIIGALIRDEEGKILLLKSHKWLDRLTIPAGHIEFGETIINAVKREVKEETGLDIKDAELLCVLERIKGKEFHMISKNIISALIKHVKKKTAKLS